MAIRIKARAGESAEQLLRRFKKMCEKEGLTKDVKRQAYYEKPSERNRRAMRKSQKRREGPIGGFGPRGAPGAAGAAAGPRGKAPTGPDRNKRPGGRPPRPGSR